MRGIFFLLNILYYNIFVLYLLNNKTFSMKTSYNDTLHKAEAIVSNPKSFCKNGRFKKPVERRVTRLVNRITFLSQFESNNNF